ncbi:MAG: TetR/AcrR family transcriptional regulator [Alphaproteobacteria bacterium]|nr:TetR/AcrR family transcriptional regulator [Alphaproteobacteria bacterium]
MARSVDPEAYAAKRAEILQAAMALIFAKGYERMTIRDIHRGLGISKGAFYHYFDSKAALLDAFIDQLGATTEGALLPLLRDPERSAIDKLQGFFSTFDRLRADNQGGVVALGRVWYGDANALVRQKVDDAVRAHRAPLLTEIVHQGVREGVFSTPYPDQSGGLLLSLIQGMAGEHARLLWLRTPDLAPKACAARVAETHAACMDAIERLLGAPGGSLYRVDAQAVMPWVLASRADP